MKLLIQNRGAAEVESFTLLGASGVGEGKIGKFGSGTKLGITQLLREGVDVRVYCGKTKLEFGLREDDFEGRPIQRVTVKEGNLKARDLGWTAGWGSADWDDVTMALREFVSNAIDRSEREEGYKAAIASGDLTVEITDKVSAKAGYTRIYVEVTEVVEKFLDELPKRFLHFSPTPLDQEILPKADRSVKGTGNACVYRAGVLVTELDGESVYDYNFHPCNLTIDECRNANEYSIRAEIAKRLRGATADELGPIFQKLGAGVTTMESGLDPYYLCPSHHTPTEEEKHAWSDAWNRCFHKAVMTDSDERNLKYVQRKGYKGQAIDSSAWREAMGRLGIQRHTDVLTSSERAGRQAKGATQDLHETCTEVWAVIDSHGLSRKDQPRVACFTEDDSKINVYVEGDTIYVRDDLATRGDDLRSLVIEGVAEYVGGKHKFILELANTLITEYI